MPELVLPLGGVRVLDLASGPGDAVTRLLADLGADVLKIEPPGGSPARTALPSASGSSAPDALRASGSSAPDALRASGSSAPDALRASGSSIAFALHNASKRSAVLDAGDGDDRRRFFDLVAGADIVVDDGIPGQAAAFGATCEELATQFSQLIALSVTDFGTAGPHAQWRATDPVLYAMSTALSRSGPPDGPPVLPPDGIASATAAMQGAWATLAAYYRRFRGGTGDYIDFSRFEAVTQALDPPFGAMGQAALGQRQADTWRGRPPNQNVYPVYPCRDGYVRICVMSPRQWHALRAWLGEPEQFQDPRYDRLGPRFGAAVEIGELVTTLIADQTMAEVVAAAQRRGIPVAPVLTPAEALTSEHFRAVSALARLDLAPGTEVVAPIGPFVVDGCRAGLRWPAPAPGEDEPDWVEPAIETATEQTPGTRPFDGLRILDLGIIVAGGELGRLFADLGAEVIKVESASYPDGLRQTRADMPMSETFARTHRNEYGLGLDLRHPDGSRLFAQLVAESDAVFANFKPGTLTALGFPYQRLREINPRIVLAESSAFGDDGPWSDRMGYGPLVRAATGITRLWMSGDERLREEKTGNATARFLDATTVFPDHVVARAVAVAAVATLVRRDRTGDGGHVHISQAEVAVNQLDAAYVTGQARTAGLPVAEDPTVHGVYPCAGDDEWCVISMSPAEAASDDITSWTTASDKADVAERMQRNGVPAGPMYRAADVLADAGVLHRKLFADMVHPLFDAPLPSETGPAPYRDIPPAQQRPAPGPGEHTREVCHKVLGLDTAEIDRLIASGALFCSPVQRKEG